MADTRDWNAIHAAVQQAGVLAALRSAGGGYRRVLRWLESFGEPPAPPRPGLAPEYPLFPGLEHRAFHERGSHPAATALEAAFETLRSEALALDAREQLDYTIASAPVRRLASPRTWLARRAPPRAWTVYPLWYMGFPVETLAGRAPRTFALLERLPGLCTRYPWGDALFSVQGPHSRLPPHCSIDNLRLRFHLALAIPPGCGIRVGGQERQWREGECLLFEDAFEHEVWNHSDTRRVVAIVDAWHPGLSEAEIEVVQAVFRHPAVRSVFMRRRISATDAPQATLAYMQAHLHEAEDEPALRRWWTQPLPAASSPPA